MKFNNLIEDNSNLKSENNIKVFSCKNFKGELSSITGIQSKFLFIAKINELSGESSWPSVKIVCEPECIDSCKYLHKIKEN